MAAADDGLRYSAADFIKAGNDRTAFGLAMDRALERFDVLVSPGCAILPFTAGLELPEGSTAHRWTEWAGFSFPINMTQQPALVLPAGKSADGRPIGLQLVGGRGRDGFVLSVGAAVQAASIV